ncbi:TetR/AcrR family transcriptional regulator [Paenibacillus sp. GCM10027627]|uniref:TetR/AcrR family transcriptional regulator n=1 Tax=unclassified Paenibacillus TaxID=185978 RepID=UPI0036440AFA
MKTSEQSKSLEQAFSEDFEQAAGGAAMEQILLHAIDVFSRKGFSGAKIKDIAQSAGFSQGYVYTYFKSKDDIFTRIVELAADGSGKAVRQAASLDGSPYQRIVWLTEAFLAADSLAMQHWRLILLQTATSEAIPAEAKAIIKAKQGEPIHALIPLIVEGQKLGELVEGDPLMLAITYFSFIQGLGISKVQTTGPLPFPDAHVILRFLKK